MIIRIHKRERDFTLLPNRILLDDRMSAPTTAVLAYLLAHPDNWEPRVADIQARFNCTRGMVRRAFKEMVKLGYAVLRSIPKEGGKWGGRYYDIVESPADLPKIRSSAERRLNNTPFHSVLNNTIPPSKAGGNGSSFSLEFKDSKLPKTEAGELCKAYYEFCAKNRLFMTVVRKGRVVTIKPNFKNWLAAAEWLLDRAKLHQIQEVMQWYSENYRSPYLKTHSSFATWCNNFDTIKKSMYRQQRRNQDSEETTTIIESYEE